MHKISAKIIVIKQRCLNMRCLLNLILIFCWHITSYAGDNASSLFRTVLIHNRTNLYFQVIPQPHSNSSFDNIDHDNSLPSLKSIQYVLSNPVAEPNGLLSFKLNDNYVFTLVIQGPIVSLHGCKSSASFFHRADYTCRLKNDLQNSQIDIFINPS